jgi:tetratricopeptide (TPR) repeat protein
VKVSGRIRGLLPLIALGACATSGARVEGPLVSPTGIVYEPGTPPTETRRSQTATLYIRQGRVDRALELALEGIAADSTNPIHYFLAGVAYARLGRYESADSSFSAAQRIYPAYELDIEPEREAAWVSAFNAGVEKFDGGDWDGTIDVWTQAALIYDIRPEAHLNLASLLAADGRYAEAIGVYQRGLRGIDRTPATRMLFEDDLAERARARSMMEEGLLGLLLAADRFAEAEPLLRSHLEASPSDVRLRAALAATLTALGREVEGRSIYAELMSEGTLTPTELFNLGIQFFRADDFDGAAEVFERLTVLQPSSRDAWFNYANSLFAAEDWPRLAEAGTRLVELDPLGENAQLVAARAQLEVGDRAGAAASLARADQAPVYVEGLQMQRSTAATTIFGHVTGNTAEAGTPVTLLFTFYDDSGAQVGTDTLSVTAPPPQESRDFEVRFRMLASAYRYEPLLP